MVGAKPHAAVTNAPGIRALPHALWNEGTQSARAGWCMTQAFCLLPALTGTSRMAEFRSQPNSQVQGCTWIWGHRASSVPRRNNIQACQDEKFSELGPNHPICPCLKLLPLMETNGWCSALTAEPDNKEPWSSVAHVNKGLTFRPNCVTIAVSYWSCSREMRLISEYANN